MTRRRRDREDRREQRYRRLGTRDTGCFLCPETDSRCMERHHIAGQEFHGDTVIVCRNCHRKLTDDQLDLPLLRQDAPIDQQTVFARLLMGICDLLMYIAQRLRECAEWLLQAASRTADTA